MYPLRGRKKNWIALLACESARLVGSLGLSADVPATEEAYTVKELLWFMVIVVGTEFPEAGRSGVLK